MKAILGVLIALTLAGCLSHSVRDRAQTESRVSMPVPQDRDVIESRMSRLYDLVRARDWDAIYDMRTAEFRDSVSRELFVDAASRSQFRFESYRILDGRAYRVGDRTVRYRFIVEIDHGNMRTYDVVWWHNEGGQWYARDIGIHGLVLGDSPIEKI